MRAHSSEVTAARAQPQGLSYEGRATRAQLRGHEPRRHSHEGIATKHSHEGTARGHIHEDRTTRAQPRVERLEGTFRRAQP